MLADHAKTIPDAVAYEEILSQHNLAVGQLRTVREFAESEWCAETGAIVEVSDRGDGVVKFRRPLGGSVTVPTSAFMAHATGEKTMRLCWANYSVLIAQPFFNLRKTVSCPLMFPPLINEL